MATELHVRILRNPHGMPGARYEARFSWNGLCRYQFDVSDELAYLMVKDKVHPEVRDEVMDALEKYEWVRTPPHFPLGVVYVGEAVCDSPIDEPVQLDCTCDYCLHGHNSQLVAELQSDMRTMYRRVGWVLVLIGVGAGFDWGGGLVCLMDAALLIETEGGPRVALGALFASFTQRERCRWSQWAGTDLAMDEFGIMPAGVERFLVSLEVKRQMEFV